MEPIRLATEEEVKAIKDKGDIDLGCTVLAMDGKNGVMDTAVIRTCTEIDPVFFHEDTSDTRKALFLWGLENGLRMMGVPFYYFNISATDTKWQETVEKWGGKKTTEEAQFRYKKLLVPRQD